MCQKVNIFNPWHSQIRQLGRNSDFISDLNGDWNIFGLNAIATVRYIVAGRDSIVARDSAVGYWGNTTTLTDIYKTHFDIIDPSGEDDISLLALVEQIKNAFRSSLVVPDDEYTVDDEELDNDSEEHEEEIDH